VIVVFSAAQQLISATRRRGSHCVCAVKFYPKPNIEEDKAARAPQLGKALIDR
jgi:hypothetical protein